MRRFLMTVVFGLSVLGLTNEPAAEAQPAPIPRVAPQSASPLAPHGQSLFYEIEANNTHIEATNLPATNLVVLGNIFPMADVDYYAFSASAGDRVYAAVMTSFDASAGGDSVLSLYGTNGTSLIETDDNDGSFGSSSSSIAGAVLPATGTYFLRVSESGDNSTLRPYHLHVRVQSGSPAAEVEPNNLPGTAQPLPASGWVSGLVSPSTDVDYYLISLEAGDTVFASLDLNPSRAEVEWTNGRLGLGIFGNNILLVNDPGAGPPSSEALFMTVKEAGDYVVYVDSGNTGSGPYHLSVSVRPASTEGTNCTTYTSTDVPQALGPGTGTFVSTLSIPDRFVIADLDVSIHLTHTLMTHLDAVLVSPAGNTNGLFSDVGSSVAGSNTTMNLRLDDEAGSPIGIYTVVAGMVVQPESAYRLHWFDGEQAFGQWSLVLYDDTDGEGGTLLGWSLTACAAVPPECPAGLVETVVFHTDFESGADGFTHNGSQDEWELGLPTHVPVDGCYSGSACWATDLDDTYNANSDQNLLSPAISLAGYSGRAWVTWAQKYQFESAAFDHAHVDALIGEVSSRRLWEWLDGTMTTAMGAAPTTVQQSAGWGLHTADVSDALGQNLSLRFHLDSDATVQLGGLAIDHVTVTACQGHPLFLPYISK